MDMFRLKGMHRPHLSPCMANPLKGSAETSLSLDLSSPFAIYSDVKILAGDYFSSAAGFDVFVRKHHHARDATERLPTLGIRVSAVTTADVCIESKFCSFRIDIVSYLTTCKDKQLSRRLALKTQLRLQGDQFCRRRESACMQR